MPLEVEASYLRMHVLLCFAALSGSLNPSRLSAAFGIVVVVVVVVVVVLVAVVVVVVFVVCRLCCCCRFACFCFRVLSSPRRLQVQVVVRVTAFITGVRASECCVLY